MKARIDPGTPAASPHERTVMKRLGLMLKYIPSQRDSLFHLDVGCGIGAYVGELNRLGYKAIGIDMKRKHLISDSQVGNSKGLLVNMDASELGFKLGVFTSASLIEVLEHVTNPAKVLSEVARVLTVGGILIVSVPYKGFPFETHGIFVRGKIRSFRGLGFPFLTFMPKAIRSRFATANVFTEKEMQNCLGKAGFRVIKSCYLFPSFDVMERYINRNRQTTKVMSILLGIYQTVEKCFSEKFGSTLFTVSERIRE